MMILHLNLKKEYFDQIKNNTKSFEYRLDNPYWQKRLIGRHYDEVHFKCGYPKATDTDKIIKRKYIGYEMRDIRHKHFGNTGGTDPQVVVFAIHTIGEEIK